MLHVVPEYPDGHSQVTPPTVSRHVPPELQLVLVQSGKSETNKLYLFVALYSNKFNMLLKLIEL